MAEAAAAQMQAAGVEVEYTRYPDAGHAFNTFYVPTYGLREGGGGLALGGKPSATAHASIDSWERTLDFLAEHLRAR